MKTKLNIPALILIVLMMAVVMPTIESLNEIKYDNARGW